MPINRSLHDKTHPFTQISNHLVNNRTLTLQALGLMTYLLSKLPTHYFTTQDMIFSHLNDRFSVRSTIKELLIKGYIFRTQLRYDNKKFSSYLYEINENPIKTTSPPQCGFPTAGKPTAGKPTAENCTPVNNKIVLKFKKETTTSPTKVVNTTAAVLSPEYKEKYKVTYDFLKSLGVINQKSIIDKYGLDDIIKYSHAFPNAISTAGNPTGCLVIAIREKWEIIPISSKKPKPFRHDDICISCHVEFYYLDFKHTRNICGKCEEKEE